MPLQQAPVKPTDIAVLAISVVVAALRTPHLIAHEQHRRAGRQQFQREKILYLPVAQRLDGRIVSRPLSATVPTQVVIRTVAIVLAVGLVVFVVVRDQIIESKAVMAGYKIDALLGLAFLMTVNVGTAQQPGGHAGHGAVIAPQKTPDIVAESAVPLLPSVAHEASTW